MGWCILQNSLYMWVSLERPEFTLLWDFKMGKTLWWSTLLLSSFFLAAAVSRWHRDAPLRSWGTPRAQGPRARAPGRDVTADSLWGGTILKLHLNLQVNNGVLKCPTKHLIYNILWERGGIFSRGFFQLKNVFSQKSSNDHFPLHLSFFCLKVL